MLASDVLRAAVVGVFAILTATGQITMTAVYGLALLFGIVHAFFFPAASSIMPELVPGGMLRQANALNQVTSQIVLFAAPALAGWLVATVGTAGGFAVDAGSFLISAVFLILIVTPPRPSAPVAQSAWRDLTEGFGVVRRDRLLAAMIGMASLFFFGYAGATYVGLPVLGVGALFVGGGAMIAIAGLAGWTVPELRELD